MSGLRSINLDFGYWGKGEDILTRFVLPCLKESCSYDRVTSYYNFQSLLAIAEGLQHVYYRKGTMRLVLGLHSIPPESAEAEPRRERLAAQISHVRNDILAGASTLEDSLLKKRLATLAWMMEDGLLQVKAAAVIGEGIFHPKTLLFSDPSGDRVAAVGSSNETGAGHGCNYEQLMVACSWDSEGSVSSQETFFESLWSGECADAVVADIDPALAREVLAALGPEHLRAKTAEPKKTGPVATSKLIETAAKMPSNFFVSGTIPALFQHQERAVIEALSRWPVRVLLADEVGLGKTFEAAAVLSFLVKYCGVCRVLILTPKAVLKQWQEELKEHFGLDAWLFDSTSKSYISPDGGVIKIGVANPLGENAPSVMLMSAQYARGSGRQKPVFERTGTVLPDLLVLDEAHAARVSRDIGGGQKATRLYDALANVVGKIPHVVFATATPMQKETSEYHAMLKLLGLPNAWRKPRPYLTSLELVSSDTEPSTTDAYTAGKLLKSSATMLLPCLGCLDDDEKASLDRLLALPEEADRYDVAGCVMDNWPKIKSALVKLHPARLLTVRNTRRSLEQVGYFFPRRNLIAESVTDSAEAQLFYMDVDNYMSSTYFSAERVLHPDKNFNIGFVRVNYQQRLASSLHSCRESLAKRLDKLASLKRAVEQGAPWTKAAEDLMDDTGLDDLALDDDSSRGGEIADALAQIPEDVDLEALHRAVSLELAAAGTLLAKVKRLLGERGDQKVSRAIQIALRHLEQGDKVLVFSRYTDTIDALTRMFSESGASHPYGIYDGDRSVKVKNGVESPVTKQEIKRSLETGSIQLMFCSDAASEGLNLQAARVLVNVDVPWTPARLEQRIGRVARLGQKATEVEIYNVWYPNSVEARMYSRIQRRLEETNLAVGEFPAVVADKILDSVMAGGDDDGMEELREIRDSLQAQALASLWSRRDPKDTTSRIIRNDLLSLCADRFKELDPQGETRRFVDKDGKAYGLTANAGDPESVSLTSEPLSQLEDSVAGVEVLRDPDGNPAAFTMHGHPGFWVNQEYQVDFIAQGTVPDKALTVSMPNTLPDPTALDLSFAVECPVPPRPVFWPPTT